MMGEELALTPKSWGERLLIPRVQVQPSQSWHLPLLRSCARLRGWDPGPLPATLLLGSGGL